MKILYIIPYIPFPVNSGGSQAVFSLTNHVRKEHDVSILLYVHNSKDRENASRLQEKWPDVEFFLYEEKKDNTDDSELAGMSWKDRKTYRWYDYLQHSMFRKKERLAHKKQMMLAVSTGQGDLVRSQSTLFVNNTDMASHAFLNYVKQVSSLGFDAIQVEFYEYLPLVYILPPNVRKIFVHHEIRFIRCKNEMSLFKRVEPSDTILYEKEKAMELGALSAYDAIVTLTETDKQILSRYLDGDKITVSPAITQTASYTPRPFSPASDLVFVGSGSHFPNMDAVLWFCREIVPKMKNRMKHLPAIYVVGIWDKKLVKSLTKFHPEVKFVGFVDDLQTFLNGKISIVPIRIGSGMRIKILDSIFAAAPIVTTSKGCEGLPMTDHRNCLIADDADAFAEAIERLQSDLRLQERLVKCAMNATDNILGEKRLVEKRLSVYTSSYIQA